MTELYKDSQKKFVIHNNMYNSMMYINLFLDLKYISRHNKSNPSLNLINYIIYFNNF